VRRALEVHPDDVSGRATKNLARDLGCAVMLTKFAGGSRTLSASDQLWNTMSPIGIILPSTSRANVTGSFRSASMSESAWYSTNGLRFALSSNSLTRFFFARARSCSVSIQRPISASGGFAASTTRPPVISEPEL
jgi:hypothetical protein